MKKLLTIALALITVTVLTGAALGGSAPWFSGSTPWFNRDRPSGVGDYETTRDLLAVQCRFTAPPNQAITEGSPVGYHCNIKEGGWCKNNDPAGLACKDMQVKFSW